MTLSKPDQPGQRLHPVSPLFLFIQAVVKLVFPLVVSVIGTRATGTGGDTLDWILLGFGVFASLGSILQYWFYRYWLEDDRIVVQSGVFFKSLRQVPYLKIQNLNIERNPLHRILGVATLQIESASGTEPEAVIRVISTAEVEKINAIVKGIQSQQNTTSDSIDANTSAEETTEDDTVFSLTDQELTKYGFISHKALLPVGIVFSFIFQNDAYQRLFYQWVQQYFGQLQATAWSWSQWLIYIGLGLIATLVAIWLASIILAFLQLFRFNLSLAQEKIHAHMGLLTNLTASIPLKRIQLVRIKSSPLHRFFRRQGITMETAGGVNEATGITMRWLAPLIEPKQGQQLLNTLLPAIKWSDLPWQKLEHRAWKRIFKRLLFFTLVIAVGLSFISIWLLTVSAPLILLSYIYAKTFIRLAAYAIDEHCIAYRSGIFFRKISVVRIEKIHNFTLQASPLDRWNNMAQITVDTAGSNIAAHHVHIPFLNRTTAEALHKKLATAVTQTQFEW
ncbi:PH domain-containing protein [Marinicella sp. W31]|uniref:PH domain-containing protein n=1 Tax=Marinicella sp. W31 TaxID=3023713 RepID=UPI003756C4BC